MHDFLIGALGAVMGSLGTAIAQWVFVRTQLQKHESEISALNQSQKDLASRLVTLSQIGERLAKIEGLLEAHFGSKL